MGREKLIKRDRGIIIAADVPSDLDFRRLVSETAEVEGITGYKIGAQLALRYGLPSLVNIVNYNSDLPVIYDHQKAGNDIPEFGPEFAEVCADAGVDSVILFPFTGPRSEIEWIEAAQKEGLNVMVGGHMTHPEFLESEGGFISDRAPRQIYTIAAKNGVTDFVLPGNKPRYSNEYIHLLKKDVPDGEFDVYAPGFINQGGEISEFGNIAGKRWQAIIGRAIYNATNMNAAAKMMVSQIS